MRRILTTGFMAGAALAAAACSDRLNVPNFQNPTVGSVTADPVAALQVLATGVLRDDRGAATTYVLGMGILGREAYNYTPTEGRNTSGWLTSDVNNGTSFGGGALWAAPYFTMRDAFNTLNIVEAAPSGAFTDPQKNAVRGFIHTMQGLSALYIINTRNDLGMVTELSDNPILPAPFVSRDSAFRYIVGRLDQAATELGTAGTTFPFTFHAGYAGFNTPANYIKFNRALAARVNAYRASLGVGGCTVKSATCYQTVLTNLSQSFVDPAASLTTGPFNVYSAAANDVANGIANQSTTNVVAHAKADSGIQLKADNTNDNRFINKVIRLSSPKQPPGTVSAVPTNWDYSIYALRTDPVPIIRNEELILLRAEARWYTGDAVGALADINTIRTRSGGLAARVVPFADETDFLNELLYNRRLSLLFEGHRWIDMRRFGRLNQLTIDVAQHVVVARLPVPQGECLVRQSADASLKAPGCP